MSGGAPSPTSSTSGAAFVPGHQRFSSFGSNNGAPPAPPPPPRSGYYSATSSPVMPHATTMGGPAGTATASDVSTKLTAIGYPILSPSTTTDTLPSDPSAPSSATSASFQHATPVEALPSASGHSGTLQTYSYSPAQGEEGVMLRVWADVFLSTASNPPSPAAPTRLPQPSTGKQLRILFGTAPVATRVNRSEGGVTQGALLLSAAAPPFAQTQWTNTRVALFVQALDDAGRVVESVEFGSFTYWGVPPSPRLSTKRSGDPLYSDRASPSVQLNLRKATSQPQLRDAAERSAPSASFHAFMPTVNENPTSSGLPASASSPFTSVPTISPSASRLDLPDTQSSSYASASGSGLPTSSKTTPSSNGGLTPPPGSSAATPPAPAPVPPGGQQPQLIRTSQIQGPPGAPYNPYTAITNKASLQLHGNLQDMAVQWTQEEWNARRRLVQFWRRQDGPVIHATFRPISQQEYVPNSIVISCIFREDRNECFVTSVDAIYLLEALVGVRFSVEEKNRIRRNLEGFRPMTVSKAKPESEDFFKLIMSFPNPKPRNIEKDVKVFPWAIMTNALKKIIGKYSANYPGYTGPPPPSLPPPGNAPASPGPPQHPTVLSPPINSPASPYSGSTPSFSDNPGTSYGPPTSQPSLPAPPPLSHGPPPPGGPPIKADPSFDFGEFFHNSGLNSPSMGSSAGPSYGSYSAHSGPPSMPGLSRPVGLNPSSGDYGAGSGAVGASPDMSAHTPSPTFYSPHQGGGGFIPYHTRTASDTSAPSAHVGSAEDNRWGYSYASVPRNGSEAEQQR